MLADPQQAVSRERTPHDSSCAAGAPLCFASVAIRSAAIPTMHAVLTPEIVFVASLRPLLTTPQCTSFAKTYSSSSFTPVDATPILSHSSKAPLPAPALRRLRYWCALPLLLKRRQSPPRGLCPPCRRTTPIHMSALKLCSAASTTRGVFSANASTRGGRAIPRHPSSHMLAKVRERMLARLCVAGTTSFYDLDRLSMQLGRCLGGVDAGVRESDGLRCPPHRWRESAAAHWRPCSSFRCGQGGVEGAKVTGGAIPMGPDVREPSAMPFGMLEAVTQLEELEMLGGALGVPRYPTVHMLWQTVVARVDAREVLGDGRSCRRRS
ncbi:hypothetical protein B0H11DRAFT_2294313 [Mycena galericulata]|nr:hypothetical protein B0H11DRAFT_2294313 [Mycena galericulata]